MLTFFTTLFARLLRRVISRTFLLHK